MIKYSKMKINWAGIARPRCWIARKFDSINWQHNVIVNRQRCRAWKSNMFWPSGWKSNCYIKLKEHKW
jgi:hypothetical protein